MLKTILSIILTAFISIAAKAQCDFPVPINPNPEVPGNAYCSYESVELKTTMFDTYQWEYKFYGSGNSWTEFTGGTDQTLTINAGEWAGTFFRVTVTQDTCTVTSDSLLIDGYVFIPPFIIQDSPSGEFCIGDSTKLQAGGPPFDSIQWLRDYEPIPGANDPVYWVKESGNYVLIGFPAVCPEQQLTSGVGPTFTFSGPDVPNITASGDTLFASSGPNYQWLLNGNPINGADQDFWVAQMSGNYSVEVSDANGCTATSDAYSVVINAVENPDLARSLQLSPNPVTETLTLQSSHPETLKITILDTYGRLIVPAQSLQGRLELNLSELAPGFYLAKVETKGNFAVVKFLKQ